MGWPMGWPGGFATRKGPHTAAIPHRMMGAEPRRFRDGIAPASGRGHNVTAQRAEIPWGG